ncbi:MULTISPECIES: ABC transporter substrate-binding protein [Ruegeria]|uniref:Extracellular solute-binding protein n=1 Tax=Ruegeria atlantica TaxID=81569 RepID=A0AA90Z200_9RHOB|nr:MULTISPECIES: ABC transporter substrate-binding protein [Ruegeria]NOD49661.1 extracellular solute-binding protein [Ruegeria sp. HKCCD5849]NOD53985.1 extracellular solute-binding protein [Ruegeria sp. HKCCD5851]NOD69988.1 extracellular solute-binding protein [Ruegeria sp. HKCCD7303]NOE20475.1 extracellular solute-binding protein [Ruegeria atlantica]
MMKDNQKLKLTTALVAGGLAIASPAFAEGEVVFASWGGSFQDALRSAMLEPAAGALNITVKEDTTNGIQDVRAQITAGAVAWDVTEQDLPSCETLSREGSLEPIDYSIVDTTGIPKELIHDNYIGFINFTKVIAYRKDAFGDNGPSNWAEFWDLENFPGKRGMHGKVNYNLEAALMADGVPMAEIYDTLATNEGKARAWDKLGEIAPEVTVWYRGGSQSAQLLRDGEVDVIHMGHNRVESVIASGIDVAYAFDGGTMDVDCLLVPKGAPNKDNAMRLINELLSAEAQARLAVTMPLGPVNSGAFGTGIISDEMAVKVNTHPDNYGKQLLVDPNFYIGQLGELTEEFDTLIQQ